MWTAYGAMKSSNASVAILALAAAFLIAAGLWTYEVWQNIQWKSLVHSLRASEGAERAKQDFLDGKLQLYLISETNGSNKPSMTNEGIFQIVSLGYNPNVFNDLYMSEAFIQGYNRRMRSLQQNPQKTITRTIPEAQRK